MDILVLIIGIAIFLLLEAFFSGSETALISVNRLKLENLAHEKVKSAVEVKDILKNPDRILSTTLTGTNLSVVGASVFFTALAIKKLGANCEWLTTAIMTPIILILGESLPKSIFRHNADSATLRIVKPLKLFMLLFAPVVAMVLAVSRAILFPFTRKQEAKKSLFVTREELKSLLRESEREGVIEPYERATIYRIFEFGSKKAEEVMIPLERIVSLSIESSINQLKDIVKQTGFSRILVYKDDSRNLVGFVNIFDILYQEKEVKGLADYLREVLYFSQETPIDKVFFELQLKRKQIAVLNDEQQRPVGMVTLKDLLDEIVGEA